MKRYLTPANLRLLIEIILVAAALIFALGRSTPSEAAPAAAPDSPAATDWYECITPNQVAVFNTRVHVHCASTNPTISGVSWFAVATSPDSASASRYLSVFQTSMVAGKRLFLYLDPSDTSLSGVGCNAGDCRRITGAEIIP